MRRAQKRVKLLMPAKSNDTKSTKPKEAQNRDCEVSKRLKNIQNNIKIIPYMFILMMYSYFENRLHMVQAFS